MVGEIASASRPDDFSRSEESLHSPAQASYWNLMGLCGVSDAREVHGSLSMTSYCGEFDWARSEEEMRATAP